MVSSKSGPGQSKATGETIKQFARKSGRFGRELRLGRKICLSRSTARHAYYLKKSIFEQSCGLRTTNKKSDQGQCGVRTSIWTMRDAYYRQKGYKARFLEPRDHARMKDLKIPVRMVALKPLHDFSRPISYPKFFLCFFMCFTMFEK